MEQNQKHYYAFISHSTTDEKVALWLRKELEGYHIPSAVQRDYHAPKHLKPIFLYQTDLAGIQLEEALSNSLADSQYLIVVCSPSAAQSGYVNNEVQHFIDTGRADKIIPFIVSGTPYASQKGNSSDECFPPALISLKEKGQESRGINLSEMTEKNGSKMSAVVNVIASMLGVRYDVLWDRYQRRQRKIQIAVAIGVFLLCLVGLFIWDYTRPTYRYFADYVDKWGVPEGVIELTKEQQRHRNRMYQFEYHRTPFGELHSWQWRVVAVRYVNSAKSPQDIYNTEYKDRFPIQKVEYNSQTGDVAKLIFCDKKEKVLLRHMLSERNNQPACVADFLNAQEQKGQGFIGANLTSMSIGTMDKNNQRSNIVRYVYERDSNGYIIRQTYHANNDYNLSRSAVPDADGIFGCSYTIDSLGRRIRIDYLGLDGNIACTKLGVAGRRYEYDKFGNIHKAQYVNRQGRLVLNDQKWAIGEDNADEWGNIYEEIFYELNGAPCLSVDGYSKCTIQYDDRGNMIEAARFGTDGKPCFDKDGVAKWTAQYDDRGNRIEIVFLGIDGKPCVSAYGYAKRTSQYDNRGYTIKEIFYGTDGKFCFDKDGVAKVEFKYDDRGNEIERVYYGTNNQLCYSTDGFARRTSKYDDRGNEIERVFYDIDNNICFEKNGVAINRVIYDERGNMIESVCYGTDGKPCLSKEGYAKWTAQYDDRGNRIEEVYYGTDGKLCLDKWGVAKCEFSYDDQGNKIERTYYGTDGTLCSDKYGIAKYTYKYDDSNTMISENYFNQDRLPINNIYGFAGVEYEYDEKRNLIKSICVDINNKPCNNIYGYSKYIQEYNDRNLLEQVCFLDTLDNLCMTTYGYAKLQIIYDEKYQRVGDIYYDSQNCIIANNVYTEILVFSSGAILNQGIPLNSILIKWNDWEIGESQEKMLSVRNQSRYGKKDAYFLTPDGEIMRISVESGLLGATLQPHFMDATQAKEVREQLKREMQK